MNKTFLYIYDYTVFSKNKASRFTFKMVLCFREIQIESYYHRLNINLEVLQNKPLKGP